MKISKILKKIFVIISITMIGLFVFYSCDRTNKENEVKQLRKEHEMQQYYGDASLTTDIDKEIVRIQKTYYYSPVEFYSDILNGKYKKMYEK